MLERQISKWVYLIKIKMSMEKFKDLLTGLSNSAQKNHEPLF